MPLTRKILADLGVPKEHIDAIMGSREEILEGYFTKTDSDKAAADAVAKALDEAKKTAPDITKHPDYIKLQTDLTAKDAAVLAARKDAAVQVALTQAKAKNAKAVMALLDADKLELQDDGSVKGLKDALEALQKSDAYLFEPAKAAASLSSGLNPPPADGGTPPPATLQDAIQAGLEAQMKG